MKALQVMDRYQEEVIQVNTEKNDVKVPYLYDTGTSGNDGSVLNGSGSI